VKLEFAWQGFKDFDSINLRADAVDRMLRKAARMSVDGENFKWRCMLANLSR